MAAMTTEVWQGPCVLTYPNGDKWGTETTVTSYSKVRKTPFGPVDFGWKHISAPRWVKLNPSTDIAGKGA